MLSQLTSTQLNVQLQSELEKWLQIIQPLYLSFVTQSIQHRRNIKQAKFSDQLIIDLMCWQIDLKITVQTRFYHFLETCVFPKGTLPERPRFNRLYRLAGKIIQFIRVGLAKTAIGKLTYTIIDSLPMPICAPIRNFRAKAFRDTANIG